MVVFHWKPAVCEGQLWERLTSTQSTQVVSGCSSAAWCHAGVQVGQHLPHQAAFATSPLQQVLCGFCSARLVAQPRVSAWLPSLHEELLREKLLKPRSAARCWVLLPSPVLGSRGRAVSEES